MICEIRPFRPEDEDRVWEIIREVISAGDTYTFAPDSSREEMIGYWCGKDKYTFVAESDNLVLGTFIIKPNQPGLGDHIANASYMTHHDARGKGIGTAMATFSLEKARELGFQAMQFNIVIKSNEGAVRLWQKLGFEIIGEIPGAFRHAGRGLTNAYIMYKSLR